MSTGTIKSLPVAVGGATFMPTGLGKALDVVATSRNWRTVTRLAEMAQP